MDLRSAHKIPEKPAPRLRLSLTRSLLPEDDHQPYRQESQHRLRTKEFRCFNSNPPSPRKENWEEHGEEDEEEEDDEEEEENSMEDDEDREEEQEETQKNTAKESDGILNGMCVTWSANGL